MTSKCVVCGKDFISKTAKAKYCSKVCSNHSRYPRWRSDIREQSKAKTSKVLEYQHSSKTHKEIAEEIGVSPTFVSEVFRKHGFAENKESKRNRNLKIVEMRKEGKSISEIAEILGRTEGCIGSVCRKYGVGGKLNNRKATRKSNSNPPKKSESDVVEFVAERCEGFEYVGGYTGCDGTIEIKCKKCGTTSIRSMITIRHSQVRCNECVRKVREAKNNTKILTIQHAKLRKEAEKENRFWEQSFNQTSFKECPVCGAFFIGRNKYCSDACAKHISNIRKDKRFGSRKVNRAITAKTLYKRDNGICWICGSKCDITDYAKIKDRTGNETIVCGNSYPSVDHIVPVCEGGEDSWDNVRLACRYCNSKRYWEAYREK